jgi:hypothetical protein
MISKVMSADEKSAASVELMWTEVAEESDDDETPTTSNTQRTAAIGALLALEQSHVTLLRDLDQLYLTRAVNTSLTTPALRQALAVADPRRSLVQLTGIVQLLADRHDALATSLLRVVGDSGSRYLVFIVYKFHID